MRNFSLHKILSVAKTEYIKWITNPRMIIVIVMMVFIKSVAIDPLLENSAEMNSPLNMLEPFIAVGNSGLVLLILPIVYMTLMSDFPKVDGNAIFYMIRTGKVNWLIGQILFSISAIITYISAVLIGSILPLFGKAFWANGWSLVTKQYEILFPEKAGGIAAELLPKSLYNQLPPFSAAIQSYILIALYLFALSLIMILFYLFGAKVLGTLTNGAIISIGVALTSIKTSAMWLLPMANTIIWLHHTSYFREPIKPISYSYIYFVVLILVLLILCIFAVRKSNFSTIKEV